MKHIKKPQNLTKLECLYQKKYRDITRGKLGQDAYDYLLLLTTIGVKKRRVEYGHWWKNIEKIACPHCAGTGKVYDRKMTEKWMRTREMRND